MPVKRENCPTWGLIALFRGFVRYFSILEGRLNACKTRELPHMGSDCFVPWFIKMLVILTSTIVHGNALNEIRCSDICIMPRLWELFDKVTSTGS